MPTHALCTRLLEEKAHRWTCPPTVIHRTQNITVIPPEMSTVAEQTLCLLTGWWRSAVPTDGKTRQARRRQAPQHVGEEIRVGGHREAVEVGARHWVAFARHDGRRPPSVTKLTLEENYYNKNCESVRNPGWFIPPWGFRTSRYSKKSSLYENGCMLFECM